MATAKTSDVFGSTKATEVKEVAKKAPAKKATETKEAVKETAKETAKKVEKKAATAAKKVTEKAAAAKKTVAKKATTAKTVKPEIFVEYAGKQLVEAQLIEKVKEDCKKQKITVKSLSLYIKPEDNACYYVVNEEVHGKVDLFK